jgi:hypothetical protein
MSLEQTGPAVAHQQRLEDAVAAYRGEVVGVQQRLLRVTYCAVDGHHHSRSARHGQEA